MGVRESLKDFRPYEWEPSTRSLAEAYGLKPDNIRRFDTNTSPIKPTAWLQELARSLTTIPINQYPDASYKELKEALAEYAGLEPDNVIPTNGADEALDLVAKAYLEKGEKCLASSPTYSLYRIVAQILGAHYIPIPRREDFSDDLEAMLERAVRERARIVFLCSPNNPTGNSTKEEVVEALLQETSATVVIDEAYQEFSGRSFAKLVKEGQDRLIIVRTLSKAFSLAGARVGYILATKRTIEALNLLRPPNSLGHLSVSLALMALRDLETVKGWVKALVEERERCLQRLRSIRALLSRPTETNFLLFKPLTMSGERLHELLLRRGLVLRKLQEEGVRGYLRFTIASREDNDTLLEALQTLLA